MQQLESFGGVSVAMAMNISQAQTEAMRVFYQGFLKMDAMLKVGSGAFEIVQRMVSGGAGPEIMGAFVDSAGEPWSRGVKFHGPADITRAAKSTFIQTAIVSILSNFDWFTISLVGDYLQFDAGAASTKPFAHKHSIGSSSATGPYDKNTCCLKFGDKYGRQHKLSVRVEDLTADLGVKLAVIDHALPVFHYFRIIRNNIAHNAGMADSELVKHTSTPAYSKSLSYWSAKAKSKKIPVLPIFQPGIPIAMEPRHAVLINIMCMEMASALNVEVVNRLGGEGLVRMATFHALLTADHPMRSSTPPQDYVWAVRDLLRDAYRVQGPSLTETQKLIGQAGLKNEAQRRWRELYKTP
jgi:hypothetical protein